MKIGTSLVVFDTNVIINLERNIIKSDNKTELLDFIAKDLVRVSLISVAEY